MTSGEQTHDRLRPPTRQFRPQTTKCNPTQPNATLFTEIAAAQPGPLRYGSKPPLPRLPAPPTRRATNDADTTEVNNLREIGFVRPKTRRAAPLNRPSLHTGMAPIAGATHFPSPGAAHPRNTPAPSSQPFIINKKWFRPSDFYIPPAPDPQCTNLHTSAQKCLGFLCIIVQVCASGECFAAACKIGRTKPIEPLESTNRRAAMLGPGWMACFLDDGFGVQWRRRGT